MARWFVSFVAAAAAAATTTSAAATTHNSNLPVKLETRSEIKSRVANVHLEFERDVEGVVTFTYGPCPSKELRDTHHTIVATEAKDSNRLVWVVPEDAESDGCLQAWGDDGSLLGRSEPQTLHHHWRRRKRNVRRDEGEPEPIEMGNETGIDTIGAWFEGVKLLQHQQPAPIHVEQAKAKEVAIVGAGMAGLTTWLVLEQAGLTNLSIIEGSNRLGGRVRTEYLTGGPFDYSYQEMGPMRFPYQFDTGNGTIDITDQKFIYQLADELNELNGHDNEWSVDFIEWIESSPNGFSYFNGFKLPSGLPPTVAQIQANSSLGPPPAELSESAEELQAEYDSYLPGDDFNRLMAENMFQAHAEWIRDGMNGLGGDTWSEFAFLVNYLGGSLEDTNALGNMPNDHSQWYLMYSMFYFIYGTWRTIDGGLNRLPNAFHPLVDDVTTYNTRIERIDFSPESSKLNLQWRENGDSDSDGSSYSRDWRNDTYDYAVIAAPFSAVRGWRLPPLNATISSAIAGVPYDSACKLALEFSERFWEQYENPIRGSCSTTTDIPLVGSICYPSYDLDGAGPATILASYDIGGYWVSRAPDDYAGYVLDAMVEIHGEHVRDLYTGKYERKCWDEDPLSSGGWASPTVGMHELYMPEYFKTHKNMIFVGEHTSVTQSWVAPAIESGIRGAVQLLLELGLVDEAKEAVDKWMARWIDI